MEGVSLAAAGVLVGLLAENVTMERELLERRFYEKAVNFEQTLRFIERMHGIREEKRYIHGSSRLANMRDSLREGERSFAHYMARLCVASSNEYGRELRKVLNAYRVKDGQASLRSRDLDPHFHAARNMLLEAGAMLLDHRDGRYEINGWFYGDFIKARYAHGSTPAMLRNEIRDKEDIGFAAELKVLEFERQTVGSQDAPNVIHIAQQNTNAGFDIASIRRGNEDGRLNLRMIEVKAVSPRNWAFTLTKNEVRVAAENKNTYFLYLVPVKKGTPIVSETEMIQNPIRELSHNMGWTIEKGDWSVSRKTSHV